MSCPKCYVLSEAVCSNDCGTYVCNKHGDYHENMDGKLRMGHSLICGNFKLMEIFRDRKRKLQEKLDGDKYKC